jgi:hypothetical protein
VVNSRYLISKNLMKRGRLPDHDPTENKIQSAASRAVKQAMEQNIERKLCTYTGASTVVNSGVVLSLTANLVRGDAGVNNSTGILIKPKKLTIRLTWSMSASGDYNTVRALVFRWADASTPVGSGLLETTGPFAPLAPISWVNHKKIRVLYDQAWCLYDRGASVAAKTVKISVDPGGKPIQLPLSGAGAIPQMDGLYLLLVSDDALASIPICDVMSALEFTDA